MALPTAAELERAEREKVDLDFGDDPIDPAEDQPEKVEAGLRFTTQMPPGSGTTDWSRVRAALIAHRLAKGRSADGSKVERRRVESNEKPITITSPGRYIEISALPSKPKGFATRVTEAGWKVVATHSATHRAAVLFQADSKENDANRHERGDVNIPAEDRQHWGLAASLEHGGQIVAQFLVMYETRPKGTSVANSFETARFWDPYSGDVLTKEATEFSDWLDIFVPPAEPRKKKKPVDEQMLGGEEWSG